MPGEANLPAGCFDDLFTTHTGMKLHDREFLGDFIRHHDAEIGDHRDRTFAREAQTLAGVAAVEVPNGCNEVEFFHKSASRLFHYQHDFVSAAGDFGCAAGTGEPGGRLSVVADDGGVDVGKPIDLRGAQEAKVHAAALQPVAEDFRSGDNGVGGFG